MARYLAWIVAIIAALSVASLALPRDLDKTRPHPSFSPEAVVRIQMEALGRNDEPYADRGIEITWQFASPGNKVFTGPLERFKTMIHGRSFGPMLPHKSVEYENLRVDGGEAQLDVIVLTADDRYVGYRFGLSRQNDPSCKGAG